MSYYVAEPACSRVYISKNIVHSAPTRTPTVPSRNEKGHVQSQGEGSCRLFGIPISRLDFFRQPQQEISGIEIVFNALSQRLPSYESWHRRHDVCYLTSSAWCCCVSRSFAGPPPCLCLLQVRLEFRELFAAPFADRGKLAALKWL